MKAKKEQVETPKKPSFPPYLILAVLLAAIGLFVTQFSFFNSSDPETVVQEQLEAIRSGELERAYKEYTAAPYRRKTTFLEFEQLVTNTPVLWDNQSIHFYDETSKGENRSFTGVLIGRDKSIAPVIYDFIQEDGEWKISELAILASGALFSSQSSYEVAEANPQKASRLPPEVRLAIVKQIEEQLKAIKEDDTARAYSDFSTKKFEESTSLEAFQDFVQSFPELSQFDSLSFGPGSLRSGRASISVTLKAEDSELPLEYLLQQEGGQWRIYTLHALQTSARETSSPKEKQAIVAMIEKQLSLLATGDLEAAYNLVSESFRETTPFETYEQFVKNYPELTTHTSVKFGDSTIQDGLHKISVVLTTDQGNSELQFWVNQNEGLWEIRGVQVIASSSFPALEASLKEELATLINEQLDAFKNNDFSKAYFAFVSEDFEESTSFEQFKEFIENFPVFVSHDSITINEGVKEGDTPALRISLSSKTAPKVDVLYRFTQEGNQWKIWGVQVLSTIAQQEIAPESDEEVREALSKHIKAIRSGDVSKAYYAHTSRSFQNTASRDYFSSFIQAYPEIGQNTDYEIDDVSFDDNVAVVTVTLSSKHQTERMFTYRFVFEGKRWKILGIEVSSQTPNKPDAAMTFKKAVFGTETTAQGFITEARESFLPQDEQIIVNLFIEEGRRGATVELMMEHLDSHTTLPSVTTTLTETGDTLVSFLFTPPPQGWPEGSYLLRTESHSPELSETYFFTVE